MADSPEAIKKSCKTYMLVFGILLVCTVLTVVVAKFEMFDFGVRGFDAVDATIGLAIASFKATLVAYIFMHLNHEKKMIYWFFGMSFVFALFLFGLTALAFWDPIIYNGFFGVSP
ncbi:MAG: cytochrome C oxidase subunit IV family protein [Akkermansiaceae bacterium]